MPRSDKYVRVYYRILDDPKFETIYSDDRHLAAWLRLLLAADAIWPSPAALPRSVRRASLAALVSARLVDLLPSDHFRIHGLDTERNVRAASGRNAAASRWQSERIPRADADPLPSKAEQEQSRDEQSRDRAPITEVIDYIEERTGRPYSFGNGSKVHETLSADVRDFGSGPVLTAMRADTTAHPDIGQLVFGASRRLHPINGAEKPGEPDPEYVASQLTAQREERRKARLAGG